MTKVTATIVDTVSSKSIRTFEPDGMRDIVLLTIGETIIELPRLVACDALNELQISLDRYPD